MPSSAWAVAAVRNAMADAGLEPGQVDGMMSYSSMDSTLSTFVSGDLGIRLNFYMDVMGGGSSTEALVGMAMGVIEAGMCETMVIFRSMNGHSQNRVGGTGGRAPRGRRIPASTQLRLAKPGPDVRAQLHAPHA